MTRDETVERVERALWEHAPAGMALDTERGILIRCDCQPSSARPMPQADWLRHVAEHATEAAMTLLQPKDPR